MFHLLGRDTASKGMSCEKDSERKQHTEQTSEIENHTSGLSNGFKLFGHV